MRFPVDTVFITQGYGVNGHTGVDLRAKHGLILRNTSDGFVKRIGWNPTGYGWFVDVDHGTYIDRYAHLLEPALRNGERLAEGEAVGLADNTGRSTGDHLHYEVFAGQLAYLFRQRTNPLIYLQKHMNEIAKKFEGQTIIVPEDHGRWYWVVDGRKRYIPDILTGWSFGLLAEDAKGVLKTIADQIPDGNQLQYQEGKYYRLVETIRQNKDKL